ncbi:MAG: trypsin-like peptidase domain-containing protein [Planctomycetota bacterium]
MELSHQNSGDRWLFLARLSHLFNVTVLALVIGFSVPNVGKADEKAHLYFFTNQGCAPCRQVEPAIKALKLEGYPVSTHYASQSLELAQKFQIDRTPTVIMTSNNRIVGRRAGLIDAVELKKWFAAIGVTSGQKFKSPNGSDIPGGTKVVINAPGTQLAEFSSPTMHQGTQDPASQFESRALQATVMLRVEDAEGISYATGTVIHSHQSESLVVTCGHVFRDSSGQGKIHAKYGFGGNEPTITSGELIFYDAGPRDIGLVAIKTPVPINPVELAKQEDDVKVGLDVFSIGCDHGQDPTIRRTRIKRKAAYDGAVKYDIFGRPVDGRSGGGLFNESGELVGICNAAVVDEDDGIYAALDTIHWQLKTVNLTHLFTSPVIPESRIARLDPNSVPTGPTDPALRQIRRESRQGRVFPASLVDPRPVSSRTNVSWSEPVEESDHEVLIVIRNRKDPSESSTVTIDDPTPELLDYLHRIRK